MPVDVAPASPTLQALQASYAAMPPVAAMQLRIAGFDGDTLRLRAPLAAHVNDKGCAFGGSLASLMTLAGWGLVTLRLQQSGLAADVYVADTQLHYRAPLFADLQAEARLAEPDAWAGMLDRLRERGRASIHVAACVTLPDGGIAAECGARFVVVDSGYDPA
jgi:thioesterase domain-containing protein